MHSLMQKRDLKRAVSGVWAMRCNCTAPVHKGAFQIETAPVIVTLLTVEMGTILHNHASTSSVLCTFVL